MKPTMTQVPQDFDPELPRHPNGKLLNLNTLHRSSSGLYWLYLADKQDCQRCPLREKCLSQQDKRGARKLEQFGADVLGLVRARA